MKLWLTTTWIRIRWNVRAWHRGYFDTTYDNQQPWLAWPEDKLDRLWYAVCRYHNEHKVFTHWRHKQRKQDRTYKRPYDLAVNRTFKIDSQPKGKLP